MKDSAGLQPVGDQREIVARLVIQRIGRPAGVDLANEAAGIAVRVWNVTTDIGIAAFLCMERPLGSWKTRRPSGASTRSSSRM